MPMRKKSTFTRSVRHTSVKRSIFRALALCAGALFLAGCGLFSGPSVTPTPTRPMAAVVPTFTSTPVGAAAAQESGGGTAQQAAPAAVQPQAPQATDTPRPTDTPVPTAARFTVKTDLTAINVNVRTGPSTAFGIIGTIARGTQFDISGRNVENTWYQFCCVGGQTGWIFASLVTVENAHLIAVAANIPPTPVPPTPVPPTATPVPAAPAPSDPCAGIGGDGCKFRLRNQDFRHNNNELKLYVGFVHEGRSDEIQGVGGSYFVELHKDGGHISAVDHNTRGGNSTHNGPQGKKYNYYKSVPLNQIPGGNVDGHYTIWVKDGTGERDSQNFTFTVSGGQGEVWLIFAQNN